MKKVEIFMLSLVVVFVLAVVQAQASVVGCPCPEPYESWCTASAGNDLVYYEDETYASAFHEIESGEEKAEARALGWELGARSYGYYKGGGPTSLYAYSTSEFIQWFEVTAAGTATINYKWDGELDIAGAHVSNVSWYDVGYLLDIYEDFSGNYQTWGENIDSESGELPINSSINESNLVFVFGDEDIGYQFPVSFGLVTWVGGEIVFSSNPSNPSDPYIELKSNFYDTAKICAITGGLAPVPLPTTMLLLGSGLVGLVSLRRRRR
jgi:hypothetical protein